MERLTRASIKSCVLTTSLDGLLLLFSGGTFVWKEADCAGDATYTCLPLLVAGGGGGGSYSTSYRGEEGRAELAGGSASGYGGEGGTGGQGGYMANQDNSGVGGGGGGWSSDGFCFYSYRQRCGGGRASNFVGGYNYQSSSYPSGGFGGGAGTQHQGRWCNGRVMGFRNRAKTTHYYVHLFWCTSKGPVAADFPVVAAAIIAVWIERFGNKKFIAVLTLLLLVCFCAPFSTASHFQNQATVAAAVAARTCLVSCPRGALAAMLPARAI